MCGRFYGPDVNQLALEMLYEARGVFGERINYNVGPEQLSPALTRDGDQLVLEEMPWAWHPVWKTGPLVNAHGEEAHAKKTFAAAFRAQRCVLPTHGFYEWLVKGPKEKLPFLFRARDARLTYIAGLWTMEPDKKTGVPRRRFVVLTTAPNAVVAKVHDRMAMILEPADVARWLDPGATVEDLRSLCRPFPAERTEVKAVSPLLNSVKNKGIEVLEAPAGAGAEPGLGLGA